MFINIDIKFEKNHGLKYSIKIFFIKILYGKIEKQPEGIVIHLNKKKAILIFYKDIFGMKEKAKPLKDYHLINLNCQLDLGIKNNLIAATEIVFLYNYTTELIKWLTFNKKPYFSLQSKVNIYENKDIFNYSLKCTILLNLLMILISLIKIFVEKIYYAFRNRLQQN